VFVRVCTFLSTATSVSLLCNYALRPPFLFRCCLSLCCVLLSHTLSRATFLLTHLGLLLHPHLMPNVRTSCRTNSVIQNDKLLLLTTPHRQSVPGSLLSKTRPGYSKLVCLCCSSREIVGVLCSRHGALKRTWAACGPVNACLLCSRFLLQNDLRL